MSDRDSSSFLWFLAGLGVGAVVGVLYAPKAGDEMRDTIRSKAQESADLARKPSHLFWVLREITEVNPADAGVAKDFLDVIHCWIE